MNCLNTLEIYKVNKIRETSALNDQLNIVRRHVNVFRLHLQF